MTCLGGTREEPREWIRIRPGGVLEHQAGRVCDRTEPRTSRPYCSPCPAYRGKRTDTTRATGLYPDGEPYALSVAEHAAYEVAIAAALEDDDFSLIAAWESRLAEGIGDQALRRIGDPDALERRAAYMREYRKAHPVDPTNAERQRRWRARHRNVNAPSTGDLAKSPPRARGTRARTRGARLLRYGESDG